ncbi:hypothetical protein GCM10010149_32330 [Nonomuraea roseoviolacea subsp. roseoviolacea]|uniref:ABC transporter permease n=1 Tax=Nonomuraea roseoviolacea subsp. carminata TaxID=160689 RepID=A0ABT1K2L2_9ACTN|nr:hypothetical protein [Nonomuraea roseoviolacea]MCP2348239.1 hypothetical protein [Nonomuraea roseoviolacea subsp. carminata]
MASASSPGASPAELRRAGSWLTSHGLPDAAPTPLLAMRLAVRRRARLADQVAVAALIMGAALAQAYGRLTTGASGGFPAHRSASLLILAAAMAGLLLVRSLLDWWVRRVDRRAGAALSRRAAHPVQPGWRAVLGRPFAAFALATFAGALVLAVSALTVQDETVRHAALVLLIGLAGVGAGVVLHLRDLLARPVVAEDEVSLTADVIMRVEDAREIAAPTVLWALPVVLLFGAAPGWWNVASLLFMFVGLAACVAIRARTPSSTTVARRVMGVR